MKPKYGVIGCGSISRFHFHGLEQVGADVVHIADLNPDAAKPYVEKFNAKFSKSYVDVIKDPDVTAVCILSSGPDHLKMALAALDAGKDVILEKTMTDSASEARQLAAAAENSGNLVFVTYMKRFFPAVQKTFELIPELGRLFSAQVRTYQPWGNFYEMSDASKFEFIINSYGGAILKCAGSHMLDLTLGMLGRPDSLYGHVDFVPGSNLDRNVTAMLEYENGMVAQFEAGMHPHKKIGFLRDAWDESVQINGVDGRLDLKLVTWDEPNRNAAYLMHYDNRTENATEYRFDIVNAFDLQTQYIYDCLEHRKKGNPNVIDGMNVDIVIEKIFESSQQKKSLEIDWNYGAVEREAVAS